MLNRQPRKLLAVDYEVSARSDDTLCSKTSSRFEKSRAWFAIPNAMDDQQLVHRLALV